MIARSGYMHTAPIAPVNVSFGRGDPASCGAGFVGVEAAADLREATAQLEQQYIRKALKKAHGSVSRCAKICRLSRRSMTTKIAEYKIDKEEYKNI